MSIKYRLRAKKNEELVNLAQAGLKEALELIVERYYPMVCRICSKYYAPWAEFEDMVQSALVGLIKAVYYYQPDKSGFTSFAWRNVESELKSFLTFLNRKKNKLLTDAVSMDLLASSEDSEETGYSFEDTVRSTARNALGEMIIERVKNFLNELEVDIFQMWLDGFSYEEIQTTLNVNFKKVDNTIQKVRRIVKEKINPFLLDSFFKEG
ncbi:sigma-70 family RNA polymerase sigma factor [Pseudothermotoga sp.]|uniref:sigma-70 family RNA polymerase sigma factor n=1 Tax=Pseudothermotoga sp. TaxID=2033661 RepID=UPI0031F62C9E